MSKVISGFHGDAIDQLLDSLANALNKPSLVSL